MSSSSALRANPFEHLKWSQVLALLEVLRECELDHERQIERRYRERATGYLDAAAFLGDIGIVARENQRIICKRPVPDGGTQSAKMVLEQILGSRNRYRAEVFRYLRRFRISAGEVTYCADASTRSKESPVRNFLMDLRIITHRTQGDYYVVDPAHISLYAHARQASTGCSPTRLASRLAEREELGLAAETAVVALEQERLGQALADRVDHISLKNAAAGYDILSATITPLGIQPRYIEVKAVSDRSFQFFWTANEVDVASVLGPLYYLYLVPIGAGGEALASKAKVISDPTSAVLTSGAWIVETDVRLCRPRELNLGKIAGCQ